LIDTQGSKAVRAGAARRVSPWLLIGVGLVVALAALVYLAASTYITEQATHTERLPLVGTPADLGLQYETVTFESDADHIPLQGWYLPSRGERAIIMVHGIGQNRWNAWERVPQKAQLFVEHGFDVLVFDLRGHGQSGGDRLGFGWLERNDVLGAVAYVESRGVAPGRIGVQGHSYGAATGLLTAAVDSDIAAVVADSAFADIRSLLDREVQLRGYPPIFAPGVGLATHRFGIDLDQVAPLAEVAKIAPRPILFIHGTADERIPVDNSRRLFAAAGNETDELWIVPGAAHVQAFAVKPELYAQKVLAFFDANLR
jgi:dipeptidyl aminopeptidase/acylaminoacyl peptidase